MDPFFEPDNKRRRLIDGINLTDVGMGVCDEDDTMEPMSYDELVDVKYKECFACEHMHAKAIENNENYSCLMKLYTTNSANIAKDAIYKKIHTYFNEHIAPDLIELRETMITEDDTDGLADIPTPEWCVDSIKAHFESHTNYPSDELLFELRLKKSLRNKLTGCLVDKRADGSLSFNLKNIDMVNKLDTSIIALMKTKKDINGMLGYSRELDY
jgi:hypothetical protein